MENREMIIIKSFQYASTSRVKILIIDFIENRR